MEVIYMLKEVDNKEVTVSQATTKTNPINPNGIRIEGAFSCFSDLPNDGSISTALVNGIFYYYDNNQDQWIRGGNVQGAKGEKGVRIFYWQIIIFSLRTVPNGYWWANRSSVTFITFISFFALYLTNIFPFSVLFIIYM